MEAIIELIGEIFIAGFVACASSMLRLNPPSAKAERAKL